MIAKQIKGRSFRGVLNYLDGKVGAQRIGGNMVGKTPPQLTAEFACSQRLNPTLERAVYHVSLAVHREEAQSDQTWQAIAKDYLKGMGFQNCQHVIYRHTDTEHDHIHVVASRTRLSDGTTVSDSWDYKRSEALVRQLEQSYNLKAVEPKDRGVRSQTTEEFRQLQRTGDLSIREQLKPILRSASADSPTMPEFIERVLAAGVEVKASSGKNRIRGISYALAGIAFSGTHIGRDYTFPGLQKHRSIDYDPTRDDAAIAQLIEQGPYLHQADDSTGEPSPAVSDYPMETLQPNEIDQLLVPIDLSLPVTLADETKDEAAPSVTNEPTTTGPTAPSKIAEPTASQAVVEPKSADSTGIGQPPPETEITFDPDRLEPEAGKRAEMDPLQKRCAEAIAPVAIAFLKLMQQNGELEQIDSERWQYKGERYAMTYNKTKDTFAIEALDERGELLRLSQHEGDDVVEMAQGMEKKDIENFYQIEKLLHRQEADRYKQPQIKAEY